MPTAVLDDRGRIVLPKDIADELGVSRSDAVVFEKRGKEFVVTKALSKTDRLEEIMDWNPRRTGKVERVTPKGMKEIWKT